MSTADTSLPMKNSLRSAHNDPIVEEVLKKVIVVGEANKNEIGKVDSGLAQTNKKLDALQSRVTVGFIVIGLLMGFMIVLQFLTLTKRSEVHVIPVSSE